MENKNDNHMLPHLVILQHYTLLGKGLAGMRAFRHP
jgi:hypothetical protein